MLPPIRKTLGSMDDVVIVNPKENQTLVLQSGVWINGESQGPGQGDSIPLSSVEGLEDALDNKADASHTHNAEDITSGTLDPARIPDLSGTYLEVSDNLSDLADAATARDNLGLGSLAVITPTGTPDGTKFLRDDGAWETPDGGGGGTEPGGDDGAIQYNDDGSLAGFGHWDDATNTLSLATASGANVVIQATSHSTLGTMTLKGRVEVRAPGMDALDIVQTNTGSNSYAIRIPHSAWYASRTSSGENVRLFSVSSSNDVYMGGVDSHEGGNLIVRRNGINALVFDGSEAIVLGHTILSLGTNAGNTRQIRATNNETPGTLELNGSGKTRVGPSGDLILNTYSDATRPAAGTAGRVIYNVDDQTINIDTGSTWVLPDGTQT